MFNIGDKVIYRGFRGVVYSHDVRGNTVVKFEYLTVREYIAFDRDGKFSTYPETLAKLDSEVTNENSGEKQNELSGGNDI